MANTHFELVTPTSVLYSGEAEMIVCRAVSGEIAFLAHHMPYIGALEAGEVRIIGPVSETGGGIGNEIRIAVAGGFVEVSDNNVTMLADVAELAADIDVERARRAQAEAERLLSSGSDPDPEAEAALRRAQVRLEVAGR
jgi:F-type H+-transporting ATPase subunit epsilon